MKRVSVTPRHKWQEAVEQLGFGFHSTEVPYWNESAYYSFTMNEVQAIEEATAELWQLCLGAVQHIIDNQLYHLLGIPPEWIPYIEKTWNEEHPAIYGRFDLAYTNGQIKLLEFNADTPTSLYEAGIVQWFWLQDFDKSKDQFNSIHEKLIATWQYLQPYLHANAPLHFTCVKQSLEDLTNTEYLRDCAIQAGINTSLIYIDDIGWHETEACFKDMDNETIKNLFKLYPWEWLTKDYFGKNILTAANETLWIEPAWKMLLSNKAILPILWQLYPNHPYLLPAYFDAHSLTHYVQKPLLSREGANVTIVNNHTTVASTSGEYGAEGYVYQQYVPLSQEDNHYPVIGSWVIGQVPAGIGIRESDTPITNNTSRFVPHLIE